MALYTYSDTIPIFINHHHTQENTKRKEEQAIEIMFDRVAYVDAEREQKHLCNRIECDTEDDVAERPPVVQSAEYEDKLGKCVCRDAKDRPDEVYDEQTRGFGW